MIVVRCRLVNPNDCRKERVPGLFAVYLNSIFALRLTIKTASSDKLYYAKTPPKKSHVSRTSDPSKISIVPL